MFWVVFCGIWRSTRGCVLDECAKDGQATSALVGLWTSLTWAGSSRDTHVCHSCVLCVGPALSVTCVGPAAPQTSLLSVLERQVSPYARVLTFSGCGWLTTGWLLRFLGLNRTVAHNEDAPGSPRGFSLDLEAVFLSHHLFRSSSPQACVHQWQVVRSCVFLVV